MCILGRFLILIFIVSCLPSSRIRVERSNYLTYDNSYVRKVITYCTGQDNDPKDCVENYCTGADNDPKDCVQRKEKIYRVDNAIQINNDFCACEKGVPAIENNCHNFCLERSSSNIPVLYGSVMLKSTAAHFANLAEWCSKEMGENDPSPTCKLEIYDGSGYQYLPLNVASNSNNFSVDIRNLSYNVHYIVRIIEENSGARSSAIHLLKIRSSIQRIKSPLKVIPISMYSCVTRNGQSVARSNTHDAYIQNFFNMHFFFAVNNAPEPLPPSYTNKYFLFCHDPNLLNRGYQDSAKYDRLQIIPNQFYLWDKSDMATYDLSADGAIDINNYILQYLEDRYNKKLDVKLTIFKDFRWSSLPIQLKKNEKSAQAPILGFFMQPWVDQSSSLRKGFCPTRKHYEGDDPLFKVIGEVVGTDTEALYVAESEPTLISKSDGTLDAQPYRDIIFIRESMLKKIWFYVENNAYYIPNDELAGQKTIQFYWPPFPHNNRVFFRRAGQLLYTIKDIGHLSGSTTKEESVRSNFIIPDKRFACVPKMNND